MGGSGSEQWAVGGEVGDAKAKVNADPPRQPQTIEQADAPGSKDAGCADGNGAVWCGERRARLRGAANGFRCPSFFFPCFFDRHIHTTIQVKSEPLAHDIER